MDVSEDSILDQHSDAIRVVEDLKKEIQCDGDVCRPIGLIPTKHYNSYVDVMKKNFADTETRVLKQRQFSSMCNKLFEDRSDYVYHASTVKNTPMPRSSIKVAETVPQPWYHPRRRADCYKKCILYHARNGDSCYGIQSTHRHLGYV